MLTTSRSDWADRARRLREHAMSVSAADRHASVSRPPEEYLEVGFNFRMTDLQAAVGHRAARAARRGRRPSARAGRAYAKAIADIAGLRPVADPAHGTTNFQSFWVEVLAGLPPRPRRPARPAGRGRHLGAARHHGRPPPAGVRRASTRSTLPVTEQLTDTTLILPLFHQMSESEQARVVDVLRQARPMRALTMSDLVLVGRRAGSPARCWPLVRVARYDAIAGARRRSGDLDGTASAVPVARRPRPGDRATTTPLAGLRRARRRPRAIAGRPAATVSGSAPSATRPSCTRPSTSPSGCVGRRRQHPARPGRAHRRRVRRSPRRGDAARDADPRRRRRRLRDAVRRRLARRRRPRRRRGLPRHERLGPREAARSGPTPCSAWARRCSTDLPAGQTWAGVPAHRHRRGAVGHDMVECRGGPAMKVPLVDLAAQHEEIADEVRGRLDEVFAATAFIGGPDVTAFEQEYAEYVRASPTASGSATAPTRSSWPCVRWGSTAGGEVILPGQHLHRHRRGGVADRRRPGARRRRRPSTC